MNDTDFWEAVSDVSEIIHEEMSDRYSFAREDKKFANFLAYLSVKELSERFDKEPVMH